MGTSQGAAGTTTPPPPGDGEGDDTTSTSQGEGTGEGSKAGAAAGAGEEGTDSTKGAQGGAAGDFELKLPEGFQPDAELLWQYKTLAKEAGLKGEVAQKVFDLSVTASRKAEEARSAGWANTLAGWKEAQKTDKTFGGANLEANLKLYDRALEKYGSPEVATFLKETGFGEFPPFKAMLINVGKATAEDTVARSTAGAAASGRPLSDKEKADRLSPRTAQP